MTAEAEPSAQVVHRVAAEHTARAVGSGELDVLGTPVLLAWLEEATCRALDLPEDRTSVGIRVEVSHLAASAIGARITASAAITLREGSRVGFEVTAHDEQGTVVATGQVRRAVVDRQRFLAAVPTPAQ
jgi:predicted thioesterase